MIELTITALDMQAMCTLEIGFCRRWESELMAIDSHSFFILLCSQSMQAIVDGRASFDTQQSRFSGPRAFCFRLMIDRYVDRRLHDKRCYALVVEISWLPLCRWSARPTTSNISCVFHSLFNALYTPLCSYLQPCVTSQCRSFAQQADHAPGWLSSPIPYD